MMRLLAVFMLGLLPFFAIAAQNAYPPEARRAFLESCIGVHRELAKPCRCIIDGIEKAMTYKQFRQLMETPTPLQDKRIATITRQCSLPPQ